jgi:EmrB/QacA subfamily drug resistance transporter
MSSRPATNTARLEGSPKTPFASFSLPAHQTWTVVLAAVGQFMVALDTLVVTTSLPALRAGLHTNLEGLEWTVNAYNLAFASGLLTAAALGDRFGRRRVFLCGVGLFALGSALAALAPNVGLLVAARAIQGGGAAAVMPLSLTLISDAFPPERRGVAIGLWGGIAGLGIAAGPILGGSIVDAASWHWIFWINVPVGAALVALGRHRLAESFGPNRRLDLFGVAISGAGLLAVTWGLVQAGTAGWASPQVIAPLAAGVVLVAAFVGWEHRTDQPMVPMSMFANRSFSSANLISLLMYAGLFGALFFVAQFLQNAEGYSPLQAGLRLLPWAVPPIIVMPAAGKLAQRFGNRPIMAAGMALQTVGLALLAGLVTPTLAYWQLAVALVIQSVGTSLCFPTVANAALSAVSPDQVGIASGTNSSLRELGGVMGVAVLSTLFARQGGYATPLAFAHGLRAAMVGAAVFSACGLVVVIVMGGPSPQTTTPPRRQQSTANADS